MMISFHQLHALFFFMSSSLSPLIVATLLLIYISILPHQCCVASAVSATASHHHSLSDISVTDLVSHINVLTQIKPPNSRTNFELGLTYQLLANAAESGDAVIDTAEVGATSSSLSLPLLDDKYELQRRAEESYTSCLLDDPTNANALSNLANLLSKRRTRRRVGSIEDDDNNNLTARILDIYDRTLTSDATHLRGHINYGLFLLEIGRHDDSAAIFTRGLIHHPNSSELKFGLASVKELLGHIHESAVLHEEIISNDSMHTHALLNLGALYHKQSLHEDAIKLYSQALSTVVSYQRSCFLNSMISSVDDLFTQVQSPFEPYYKNNNGIDVNGCKQQCPSKDDIDTLRKILNNKSLALYQLGRYTEAIQLIQESIAVSQVCKSSSGQQLDHSLTAAATQLFLISRAGCFFSAWDWLEEAIINSSGSHLNVWMPFDTLGLPVTPSWKRKVAQVHSNENDIVNKQLVAVRHNHDYDNTVQRKPRLGFMSHDFSDHPTTYLFEGVAAAHDIQHDDNSTYSSSSSSIVEIAAYSYGPPDKDSQARKRIMDRIGSSNFFDISSMSHGDASKVVCDDRPDIIFDMQGLTLGSRPQLLANRCSDIQVNYLAYPGTSGASYIDYVLVDRHVAVVERADEEFTEKLAILPRSYQANFFPEPVHVVPPRGSTEWKELRSNEGLSTSTSVFVFANLNKQDKIDPASFSAMMQCLHRVPESVLWLLEPSRQEAAEIVKRNLRASAEKVGVSSNRLVFAKRVDRAEHIQRMAAGDLFLDTFLYGAHTTATDAMRGGLPLLTLAGDSFSSRVGMSLLNSMNSNGKASSLIAYTEQEFVNVAVELATAQIEYKNDSSLLELKSIATRLIEPNDGEKDNNLFDWKGYSSDFDALSLMMLEVKHLTSGKNNMHIVLAK